MKEKYFLLLAGLSLIIYSCSPNIPSVIKGCLTNIEDTTITIEIAKDPITGLKPDDYPKVFEISEEGTFSIPIETTFPMRAVLYSESLAFFARVNLIHSGEITLTADCLDCNGTLSYQGTNSSLNSFYKDWEKLKRNAKEKIIALDPSVSDYEKSLDSLQNISLKMLDDYLNEEHLTREEQQWLHSEMIYGKYQSLNSRAYKLKTPPNDTSYQFFQSLNLNDQDAIFLSRTYVESILKFLLHEVNSHGIYNLSFLDNKRYFQKYYETINESLQGKIKDVILTNFVSDMMKNFNDLSEEYYEYYLTDCSSPEMIERTTDQYENYLKIVSEPLNDSINLIPTNHQSPKEVLSHFKDKVVLIDFWASWCSPCIAGLPNTKKLAEHYMNQEFELVYVGYMDQRNHLIGAIKEHHLWGNHIILNKEESLVWRDDFDIYGIPTYVLLDRSGNAIKLKYPHPYTEETYVLIDSVLSVL